MACISVSNKLLAVTTKYNAVFLRLPDHRVNLVEAVPATHRKYAAFDPREMSLDVASSAVSPCGKWFSYCVNNKTLSVWDIDNWQLVSSRGIPRGASKIIFTADSQNIIVADKAGEVFTFPTLSTEGKGTFLLGHISILLDMIVTPDNFIITCDRDEKIRVSHYPNAYNIQSFCLGHKEFVTTVNLLNFARKIIISSSGDGTLRLWNYLTGEQLNIHNCSKDVQPDLEKTPVPVICVQIAELTRGLQNVFVSLHKHPEVLIYTIDTQLNFNLSQRISLPEPVLYILISEKKDLWTLCAKGVQVFNLDKTKKYVPWTNSTYQSAINILNKNISEFGPLDRSNDFNVLYKRKFNETDEYQQKKKARLLAGSGDAENDTPKEVAVTA